MQIVKKILIFILIYCACVNSYAYPVAPTGKKLGDFLDKLNVTQKWLPNRDVDWLSGKSDLKYRGAIGSHCSSFVAAAAAKLGVYILQPPDHAQSLLSNAQYAWLKKQGIRHGWAPVDDSVTAQKIANQGCLVVISYANPNKYRPGHIAIVRPSSKSTYEINTQGPQIIQAGSKNYNSAALSMAFRHHQSALRNKKIVYYGHSTPYCKILVS